MQHRFLATYLMPYFRIARKVDDVHGACAQDRLAEAIMLVISGRARYKDERTVAIKSLAPAL